MMQYVKSGLFLNILGIPIILGSLLKCPEYGHWPLRAKFFCEQPESYTCLLNVHDGSYQENCNGPDIRPPGYRAALQPNLHIEKCSKGRYQPKHFSTNGQSQCIFQKTPCKEQGQNRHDNGSTKKDASCTCVGGFKFVSSLRNGFYCIPTEEDCSCYRNDTSVVDEITGSIGNESSLKEHSSKEDFNAHSAFRRGKVWHVCMMVIRIIFLIMIIGLLIGFYLFQKGLIPVYMYQCNEPDAIKNETEAQKEISQHWQNSIPIAETRFLKFFYLIYTKVPRLLRCSFNRMFSNGDLQILIEQNREQIYYLWKRFLTEEQMEMIFPKDGNVSSENLDFKVMSCFIMLQNNIQIILALSDNNEELPAETKTSLDADFARLFYFRNLCKDSLDCEMSSDQFFYYVKMVSMIMARVCGDEAAEECLRIISICLDSKPNDQ